MYAAGVPLPKPLGIVQALLSSVRLVVQAYFWLARDVFLNSDSGCLRKRAEHAEVLVRSYYAYVLFLSFPWFSKAFAAWLTMEPTRARLELDLMSLIAVEQWGSAKWLAGLAMLLGSLVAATIPSSWIARLASVVGLIWIQGLGYEAGGKINHGLHPTVWVGLMLLFLPRRRGETDGELRSYLGAFFNTQVIVGLLYSCAGISKIFGVYYDILEGTSWFHQDALPLTIAENWAKSKSTPLGGFFVTHPKVSQVLNVGVLYLETGSMLAVFRPHLHRLWGTALIAMHVSILLSMRIHFHQSAIILALMLLASPFAPTRFSVVETMRRLPAVGLVLTLLGKQRGPRLKEVATPRSVIVGLTGAIVIPTYLIVAFSRLDLKRGEFEEDIYPVAAMWMYWRVDDSQRNLNRLQRIRNHLKRSGTVFPVPKKQVPKRRRRR